MVSLMLRTKIPVTVWEEQGPTVVATALELLTKEDRDLEEQAQPDDNEEFWEAVADGHDPRLGHPG